MRPQASPPDGGTGPTGELPYRQRLNLHTYYVPLSRSTRLQKPGLRLSAHLSSPFCPSISARRQQPFVEPGSFARSRSAQWGTLRAVGGMAAERLPAVAAAVAAVLLLLRPPPVAAQMVSPLQVRTRLAAPCQPLLCRHICSPSRRRRRLSCHQLSIKPLPAGPGPAALGDGGHLLQHVPGPPD